MMDESVPWNSLLFILVSRKTKASFITYQERNSWNAVLRNSGFVPPLPPSLGVVFLYFTFLNFELQDKKIKIR